MCEHDVHECGDGDAGNGQALPVYGPGGIIGRRSFLKLAGFSFAGAGLAGCGRAPEKKAVPYLVQPEGLVPGKALWYASTCGGCSAGCGVLMKNRDGRPIKLEGHPEHPLSGGGLCAVGQATVLGLYDSQRLRKPLSGGKESVWTDVDAAVTNRLAQIRRDGGAVRLLTGTVSGPATTALIGGFLSQFADARHVAYDGLSCSAILDAHARTHGRRVLPRYRFERAEVIVSFEADFLGTWISPVEYTRGYSAGRSLEGTPPRLSQHIQIESRVSLTGANADRRIAVRPGDTAAILAHLAGELARRAGMAEPPLQTLPECPLAGATITELTDQLWGARGRSLVVCGANDLNAQLLTNAINHLLGNYGRTLDLERPSNQCRGSDHDLRELLEELAAGKVAALLIHGVNPVYDLPEGAQIAEWLKRVPLVVSFAERVDETARCAHFVCPDHHPLESWQDAEPVAGLLAITQPAIRPLGETRGWLESLARWTGRPGSAYEFIKAEWQQSVFPRQKQYRTFQEFWDRAVHDGFAAVDPPDTAISDFAVGSLAGLAVPAPSIAKDSLALALYPKVSMRDGRHAHNPWLQELPDPISKITWDNYAALSPATAGRLGITEGDIVSITVDAGDQNGQRIELPAHIQTGQHDEVVAIALGYGRAGTDRFTKIGPQWLEARLTVEPGELVGRNAAVLLSWTENHLTYTGRPLRIEKTGRRRELASTQMYDSLQVPEHMAPPGKELRNIARQTTLGALLHGEEESGDSHAGGHAVDLNATLWAEDHKYTGRHWGMAVDLNRCTGCSACVLGCQAENNIPIVGRDEVARGREMHWLRIDRYYIEQDGRIDVLHQPMMCHHCDNAGCETVCPALATVHDAEGLNVQVYNRCVGTRYCANNCPIKMRRFNWFDYAHDDQLQNLVLNPDVTVRSRGVMEKCSFCIQRIHAAKQEAKRRGVELKDGDIQPACQQSCPAGAIVFGDMNDSESEVSRMMRQERAYVPLAELNQRPSVKYLVRVRNRPEQEGGRAHG